MNDGDSAVLITGAAGGIGQAAAREFARAGHRVLALDVDASVLNLGERLGYDRIVGMTVDHRDLAAVEAALDRCNMIDLLRHVVLLAGIALPEETQLSGGRELPHPTLFQASVELNLLGHVNVIWAVQRLLFSADGDRSIAVSSSVNALQGWGEPAYSAAKAGLIGLVHALTVPYGTRGIRINAVAPGTIDTPNTRAEYVRDPDHFEVMQRGVPLGRLGQPDDVAAVLLALARDMRHVTGQVITVDGGQTIQR
jgi:NAD(P)-dependent dehydrogenase (short-subunit alcohol dehydrogenase family)